MDSLCRSFRPSNPTRDDEARRPILPSHHSRFGPSSDLVVDVGSTSSGTAKACAEGDHASGTGEGGDPGFAFRQQHPKQQEEKEGAEIGEDPPSRLISSLDGKQRASGVEASIDMDLEMEELRDLNKHSAAEDDLHFPSSDPLRRHTTTTAGHCDDTCGLHSSSDDSVGKRAAGLPPRPPAGRSGGVDANGVSNIFKSPSGFLTRKPKSRLMDPPPPHPSSASEAESDVKALERLSVGSRMLGSGVRGKDGQDEEEDDPFADEDVPSEYRRTRLHKFTLLQSVALVLILTALTCSLFVPGLRPHRVWDLALWKWEVLVLVLISGRLVSSLGVRAMVFFFERNFLLRKKVLYFVYGVRNAVRNCLWLGLVLLTWNLLFNKKVVVETKGNRALPYVTKVLICLLVATLVRLAKTLLLKVLASSFHVSTYFDRIRESLFNQYVIQTLSGPPMIDTVKAMEEEEEEERVMAEIQGLLNAGTATPPTSRATGMLGKDGRVMNGNRRSSWQSAASAKISRLSGPIKSKVSGRLLEDPGITIVHLRKLNQRNVSAWSMKRLIDIVRHGTLSTIDERISSAGYEDESTMPIRTECEAKAAAKNIFNNVARLGARCICFLDLMCFMEEAEAIRTMSLIGGDQEPKIISKSNLKKWLVNAFRERKALSLTLNDTKRAVRKLNQIMNAVLAVVIFIVWLLILGIASTSFFIFLSSQFLLVAFIFGNTCKTTFESIIFLFVVHPFDVGDRCEVDGVQMVVEEMNIMTTVFLKPDNQKITYPNSLLSMKPIANFYRSPDMGDAIDFCIHVSTPIENVAIMKERIKRFIQSKQEHWYPTPDVVLKDVEDMNKLNISVWMQHRMSHQDMGERWKRRELVVQEMIRILRELDIEYRMLPLDVNVRNMPPALTSSRLPSTWTRCGQ